MNLSKDTKVVIVVITGLFSGASLMFVNGLAGLIVIGLSIIVLIGAFLAISSEDSK